MAQSSFTFGSFLVRWALALILVFATFNPSGYSYYHWVLPMLSEAQAGGGGESGATNLALKALAGIVLLIGYVVYLRATWRSIGPIGMALAAALLAALVWVTIDFGLLDLSRPTVLTWILLFAFATIMALGISWSHVRRRVTGQADMDDVDD
jgi:hypothetical protein